MAMELVREIVAPSVQEHDADDPQFWLAGDQEGRARRGMVEGSGEGPAFSHCDLTGRSGSGAAKRSARFRIAA